MGPIPGSFNRHAFNPKTQSFVPNNPGLPIPQPISHHGSPHQGSPHHGSPHLPYNGFAPSQPQHGSTGFEQLPAILPCISPHASPSYDATKCSSRSSPGNASRDARVPERATRNPPSPVWESSYSSSKAQD